MNRACGAVKNSFKKVSHVIFDLDGLLLDTETIYTQAVSNVLKKYGKVYTTELRLKILGMKATELAQVLIKVLNLPITTEEFLDLKLQEQNRLKLCEAELMPVIHDIAKKYGKEYTPIIMRKVLGTPTMDTCKIAVTEMKLPISPEKFNDYFKHEARLRLSDIGYLPGAEKFVRHLHKNNVPIAVATSSSKDAFSNKTQKYAEYFSLFNHIVTGASDPEVKRGKPKPDIFLICAQRFVNPPEPSKCLVLEDAPNGIRAAIDAGMQCVMIPDQEIVTPDFQSEATLVLKSLEELNPEEFGLPAYKNTQ